MSSSRCPKRSLTLLSTTIEENSLNITTKRPSKVRLRRRVALKLAIDPQQGVTSAIAGKPQPMLASLSQPCMPVSNVGPTRILSFLYLGSQADALDGQLASRLGIKYILNASITCPCPPHIAPANFQRIPVNDNYNAKLLPHFRQAFLFLEKVRQSNSCVLVHCLAGISRSPTLAIAYIMQHLDLSSEEAYRYVQDKRPTISPNFNFLGQLLEYQQHLNSNTEMTEIEKKIPLMQTENDDEGESQVISMDLCELAERQKTVGEGLPIIRNASIKPPNVLSFGLQGKKQNKLNSPTNALAKLNFSTERTLITNDSELSENVKNNYHSLMMNTPYKSPCCDSRSFIAHPQPSTIKLQPSPADVRLTRSLENLSSLQQPPQSMRSKTMNSPPLQPLNGSLEMIPVS